MKIISSTIGFVVSFFILLAVANWLAPNLTSDIVDGIKSFIGSSQGVGDDLVNN